MFCFLFDNKQLVTFVLTEITTLQSIQVGIFNCNIFQRSPPFLHCSMLQSNHHKMIQVAASTHGN